jgi:hypothetical protein
LREDSLPEDSIPEEEVLRILDEMKGRDLQYDRFFFTTCTRPHSSVTNAGPLGA